MNYISNYPGYGKTRGKTAKFDAVMLYFISEISRNMCAFRLFNANNVQIFTLYPCNLYIFGFSMVDKI